MFTWQAIEAVFGGLEARERGPSIARRVAALVVGPDALRSDAEFRVDDDDLVEFARAVQRGDESIDDDDPGVADAFDGLASGAIPMAYALMGPETKQRLLEWKHNNVVSKQEAKSADEIVDEIRNVYDRIRLRVMEFYKFRNDVVHAGYDNSDASMALYEELSKMTGSFVLNLGHNIAAYKTYASLLAALDRRARRYASGVTATTEEIRETAFSSWEKRGQPIGDDWADWFAALRLLGLE